ncbi:hypothetical protein [Lapillicoccus sp.]|uniref:WapI family immunity protein n=1 Tax=Lapillicoccus sp. TaxID=1909287 RepID=UPI0025DC1C1B|nr:hypothetical protein [Lapillicoccus sp.]
MKLEGANGNGLELSVVGYQFPDAEDPRMRYSWHVVRGTATQGDVSWPFKWPALWCSESPLLGHWLRDLAADLLEGRESAARYPPRLEFTEPNLAFSFAAVDGAVLVRVELDLEFHRDRAHWRAGDPYVLDLEVSRAQLTAAAGQWDEEVSHYPDRTR